MAYYDTQKSQIDALYDAQRQSKIADLQRARDKALGEQNAQLDTIKSQYQDSRNQADVVSAQNQNRLREMMAANGLSGSGENISANVGLLNSRQQALGQLNNKEQDERNLINRRISEINDPSEQNSLLAQIEAQRSQAMMNLNQQIAEREYQEAQAEKERQFQLAQAAAKATQPTATTAKSNAMPSQTEITQMAQAGYKWDSSKGTFIYTGRASTPTGTGNKGGSVASNPKSSISWKMQNIGY